MSHEDVAARAIDEPGRGTERLPRPLKRWRLVVASKGRASLVRQSPRTESDSTRAPRGPGQPEPDASDSAA